MVPSGRRLLRPILLLLLLLLLLVESYQIARVTLTHISTIDTLGVDGLIILTGVVTTTGASVIVIERTGRVTLLRVITPSAACLILNALRQCIILTRLRVETVTLVTEVIIRIVRRVFLFVTIILLPLLPLLLLTLTFE